MTKRRTTRKERQQEVSQESRKRLLMIGIPSAVILIALAAFLITRLVGSDVEGVQAFGDQSRGHDEGVVIAAGERPPVGGVHSPIWQNCGIYDQPVEIKNAVHSMEHGAVWITYRPDLSQDAVDTLREQVRGQTYLLLSPYPGQSSQVVLTAWGIQLEVDSVTDDRIESFIDTYRLGPQTPEFGAACDGGAGRPIG